MAWIRQGARSSCRTYNVNMSEEQLITYIRETIRELDNYLYVETGDADGLRQGYDAAIREFIDRLRELTKA